MTKTNKLSIFLIFIIAIFLFLIWPTDKQPAEENSEALGTQEQQEQIENITVNLFIEDFTPSNLLLAVEKGNSVFDILETVNGENPSLNLQSKNYEGLGILVESLGDNSNGKDNKYWQYYVNGQQPMISADQYILDNDDQVEWFFKESQF